MIYGAEEGDDWTDPKVWAKANPSLGVTIGIDKVQDAVTPQKKTQPKRTLSGSFD